MLAGARAEMRHALVLLFAAVSAQRPPPFSVPKVIPQDLEINGEWWFYTLLDSQFPHDVLTPLPSAAVAMADEAQGIPRFVALPNAEYILLEFFAPWCPHCQHFAPEMVKLVTTLRGVLNAAGLPLVAVRTVDCEKLDMAALCNWADANMMPRFVFARRDVLLEPLAPSAKGATGIQELFPVGSAQEALGWIQKHVQGGPQSLPTPAPIDENAPFFGWSQPVEGAVEPPQAPAQDLEVAVVSLLHEAFSSPDFTPERKQALFDLLELLCYVGPGGNTCRQSACQMHADLQQRWGELIQAVTVSHTAQGQPMAPRTFHYLDWAAVEHGHRWCGRPWPDFAQEGWSWCRGRTPGTRGYTCGLWLLFHGLMAGTASSQEAGLPAPPKAPLQVVRGTIGAFFGCADCQQHFLAVPVTDEDLASPQAQALWLWSAHNLATERIAREELRHSAFAPPRQQWPSAAGCPTCRTPDGGSWDVDEVYKHLRSFYGLAFAVDSPKQQPGPLSRLPHPGFLDKLLGKYEATGSLRVNIEVYYYTLCPHCLYFMKLGLMPLVEARLPGSQVQITVLPIYPPLLQWVNDRAQCLAHEDCHTALAPLCALKAAPGPAPAGSPAVLAGSRFAACDISATATGKGRDPAATRACAVSAGLPWNELQACAESAESSALLRSGADSLMAAMRRLHEKTGFQEPPGMPWVFLNGDLLLCDDGQTCTAVRYPAADQPLPAPGTLLSLACSYFDPQPAGCLNAASLVQAAQDRTFEEAGGQSAGQAAAKKAQECTNCAEVGSFRWRPPSWGPGRSALLLAPLAAALGALALWRIPWQGLFGLRAQEAAHMPLSAGRDVE